MEKSFFYNSMTDEQREYVDNVCPFAIDDKVKIRKSIITSDICSVKTFNGTIKDIFVKTISNWLYDTKLIDLDRYGIISISTDKGKLEKPIPRFIITYTYKEKIKRKHWWKFWEKPIYKDSESSLTVNNLGIVTNEINCIKYDIKKENI